MYGADDLAGDSERTAFRKSEKKYKLYYDNSSKSSKKKKQPKAVDLSDVLDFHSILDSYKANGELPSGVSVLQCDFDRSVFCLDDHPGFYFIPRAIGVDEQTHWIKESLINFPQPPNRTNHNAIYGTISNIFDAARKGNVLVDCSSTSPNPPRWIFSDEQGDNTSKSISASVLLRKLRWSTLGLQFDWSRRNYNTLLPHNRIPDELCQVAKRMADVALPDGEGFQPEAAIVNYFGPGDTLGGHRDDMEVDWSRPIVSMSLGCKAIFLLGGKSREDEPMAMFMRSGDIMLMAGEARECFHGVPRIFTDEENAEIDCLESQFSHEDDNCFLEYIRTSRININIRQVF
ncbi:alpha-ketoglutarate-dependent dioxygenase alkB [Impatiens glandulifera]|uniref:alpha-ketoglutarate-dependent dioxygenase alkB n=1 Tax=Impatiens glandulifera TaxID=253017 RepID=UPI001FB159D0|nr:alpha-ketoglutarate-dependent dioxygenase alkB [Impatiens glandulifera]